MRVLPCSIFQLTSVAAVVFLLSALTSQSTDVTSLGTAEIANIEKGVEDDEKKFKDTVKSFEQLVEEKLPNTDLGSISEEEYELRKAEMLKSIENGDQQDPYVIEMMKMIQETDDIRKNLLEETVSTKDLFKDLADVLSSVESADGDTYDDILSAQVEEILKDGDDMDDLSSIIEAAESALGSNMNLKDDLEALGIDISQEVSDENVAMAEMTEDLETDLEQKKQNATLTARDLMQQVYDLMSDFKEDESGTAERLREAVMANYDKVGMLAEEEEEGTEEN